MGGCASKPKELKADLARAPAPEPAPEKEGSAPPAVEPEVKDVEEAMKKVEGTVEDDTVDEQGNKRRSLSNLFKESEDGKELAENDKTPQEQAKPESSETGEAIDVSETNPPEVEKTEPPIEQTIESVVDAPVKVETEKTIEVAPATETLKPEISKEKEEEEEEKPATDKKTEESKPAGEAQESKKQESGAVAETQKPETPGEEKAENLGVTEGKKI